MKYIRERSEKNGNISLTCHGTATSIHVAHEKNVLKIFKCGEGSNPNPS